MADDEIAVPAKPAVAPPTLHPLVAALGAQLGEADIVRAIDSAATDRYAHPRIFEVAWNSRRGHPAAMTTPDVATAKGIWESDRVPDPAVYEAIKAADVGAFG